MLYFTSVLLFLIWDGLVVCSFLIFGKCKSQFCLLVSYHRRSAVNVDIKSRATVCAVYTIGL